jgi:hypothetical protein
MDELLEEIEAFLQAQPKQLELLASGELFTISRTSTHIIIENDYEVVEYIPLNINN